MDHDRLHHKKEKFILNARAFTSRMPTALGLPQWAWATLAICGIIFLFILGIVAAWASVISIPSIDNFENRKISESTKIFDRTGNIVLYDVHGQVRRTAVPLTEISPLLQHAVISIEDANFYTNSGFEPLSFARAVLANLRTHSYGQGGSTITQQVVKNSLLTDDKTIWRKVKEIILALRLTRTYSKDQILNAYLNDTGFGGTVYGAEEASQYFYGIPAKDLTLAQSAYLAALPQAPTHLSPYGPYKAQLESRKNLVLRRMLEEKFITKSEYDSAKGEVVHFKDAQEAGIKAPHFVFYIRDYLEQKYGTEAVENGGLRVITTLDYDLQQKAEDIVKRYALLNTKKFNASNAGLTAVDPKTGQILTMVGSRDYFDDAIQGKVNIALAERQPGSSFKPFVYAAAFDKGYTPDTVVFDLQTQFSTNCDLHDVANDVSPCYSPENYDGQFKGPITLRNALAQSQNIPAVKVLYLVGVKNAIAMAKSLGITTLGTAGDYGLTLVLGGGEVKLLEMVGAYSVFANDGIRNPVTGILRIDDKDGNLLESFSPAPTQVLDPQVARLINDVLSDNVARTPEFGADGPLYFHGYTVADKTGTTNDFRDTWIIGYTPSVAAGAWAGNNDNTPMVKKIAAFIVAPMWHEFMVEALKKYSTAGDDFVPPAPDAQRDSLPGMMRGDWHGTPEAGIHDILFWVNKDNPRDGNLGKPNDVQFLRWEYPVSLWASINGGGGGTSSTPTGDVIPVSAPTESLVKIISPVDGSFFPWGLPIQTALSVPSTIQITNGVTYYLDGNMVTTVTTPPYSAALQANGRGPTVIRAVAHTSAGDMEALSRIIIQ